MVVSNRRERAMATETGNGTEGATNLIRGSLLPSTVTSYFTSG